MFTLEYLKTIEKDQLAELEIQEGIRSQISLALQDDQVVKKAYIIELIENIDKTISFLEYAEIEGKQQETLSNIEVLDVEIKSLINALEKLDD